MRMISWHLFPAPLAVMSSCILSRSTILEIASNSSMDLLKWDFAAKETCCGAISIHILRDAKAGQADVTRGSLLFDGSEMCRTDCAKATSCNVKKKKKNKKKQNIAY